MENTRTLDHGQFTVRSQIGISLAGRSKINASLSRRIGWGLIGGLAGTMVMDVLLMGALSLFRFPAFLCFSLVGDTMARFFSLPGVELAGGIPTGIITHYLIGPIVGILYSTIVVKVPVLRVDTTGKCIFIAILYVEILSQPLLAVTPLLLKMDTITLVLWFGGSLLMHLILAIILGSIVSAGLHLKALTQHRSLSM